MPIKISQNSTCSLNEENDSNDDKKITSKLKMSSELEDKPI
jgi:hypothetical protein